MVSEAESTTPIKISKKKMAMAEKYRREKGIDNPSSADKIVKENTETSTDKRQNSVIDSDSEKASIPKDKRK
jgi:hypothetical protein